MCALLLCRVLTTSILPTMGFSIKAMWHNKCPRCHHGSIFTRPFKLSEPLAMPKKCEHCEQKTEPEPGFYFGAMFLSYILSAWFLLLPTLLLVFYFKWSLGGAITFTLFLAGITYLKFLRGSRSLWLHLMVRHDPEIEQEVAVRLQSVENKEWKPRSNRMKKAE